MVESPNRDFYVEREIISTLKRSPGLDRINFVVKTQLPVDMIDQGLERLKEEGVIVSSGEGRSEVYELFRPKPNAKRMIKNFVARFSRDRKSS